MQAAEPPRAQACSTAAIAVAVASTGATDQTNNNREVDDIRDGMHPVVKSIGFETQFDVADGWTVNDKFRYADISGGFNSPFPAGADTVGTLAAGIGGAGATAVYANGPNAGQAVPGTTRESATVSQPFSSTMVSASANAAIVPVANSAGAACACGLCRSRCSHEL